MLQPASAPVDPEVTGRDGGSMLERDWYEWAIAIRETMDERRCGAHEAFLLTTIPDAAWTLIAAHARHVTGAHAGAAARKAHDLTRERVTMLAEAVVPLRFVTHGA